MRASTGESCVTPCSVNVPAPADDFTVSFTLANFEPMTIPVHITRSAGSLMTPPFTALNPNPVVAQLRPVAPPAKATRARQRKKPPAAQ